MSLQYVSLTHCSIYVLFLTEVFPCCLLQARMALEKGAQAVIFDGSDDAKAAAEVSEQTQLQLYQFIKYLT